MEPMNPCPCLGFTRRGGERAGSSKSMGAGVPVLEAAWLALGKKEKLSPSDNGVPVSLTSGLGNWRSEEGRLK